MWIHVVIFAGLILFCVGVRLNKIRFPALMEEKNRKLFLGVAFAGNVLGMALTWQSGSAVPLGEGGYLVKEENSSYEESLQVEIQGEEPAGYVVQVPGRMKESQEQEEADVLPSREEMLRRQLTEEIEQLNDQLADPEKYYLPDRLGDKKVLWRKPGDTSGALLAALCLTAAAALAVAKQKEKLQEEEKRREQMFQDYPNFVMKLTLLVQAGMTVRMAFRKIAQDYKRTRVQGNPRYAYEEILAACYEMDSGVSEADAYERFGERCSQVKYKTLATLLVQNLQKGSQRLLEMLEGESAEAFEDRKRKARVLGEAAATKLLVPMILMLLVVLAIIMIPAVLSFYG